MEKEEVFRSGYVSIIGRPNVGKSTLLNALLCEKVSIVSKRPQTTRNRIQGIKNLPSAQIIFVDTPGIHEPRNLLGHAMQKTISEVLREIDLILFVIDACRQDSRDRAILEVLKKTGRPVILLINKIDGVEKPSLLSIIDTYRSIFDFSDIMAVSALKKDGIDDILKVVVRQLPRGPRYYPDDVVTDQMERFMASEIIREKIMRLTSEELPYSVGVEIVNFKEKTGGPVSIEANIYVEREGQKGIIIGQKGGMLKKIGTLARKDIEGLLGEKVYLQLWVKIKKGWRDDKKMLKELGYD